jgi:hypothetical protein
MNQRFYKDSITLKQCLALVAAIWSLSFPTGVFAWGSEGHEIVAAIARGYLTPPVRGMVDQMLAADQDTLTPHDMLNDSIWADRYRSGHAETSEWHFVDIELDHPDLKAACFEFPASNPVASRGPAHDCIVDKVSEFTKELANSATPAAERLLALKFLLHFVGDMHQPAAWLQHDSPRHRRDPTGESRCPASRGSQRRIGSLRNGVPRDVKAKTTSAAMSHAPQV